MRQIFSRIRERFASGLGLASPGTRDGGVEPRGKRRLLACFLRHMPLEICYAKQAANESYFQHRDGWLEQVVGFPPLDVVPRSN